MATNDNLLLQIRKVIREEVEAESGNNKAELKLIRMELSNQITDLSNRIKNLDIKLTKELSGTSKDITQIRKDIKKIQTDLSAHTNYFDKEYLELKNQVKAIERNLRINLAI